ncbi:MAG: adenylate/guanylate cyclase domain-containing protein, partial [Chloroflexota bacterium]
MTALVAEIVGSEGLISSLETEAAHELISGAVDVMIKQIEALAGTVVTLGGGATLAIFGAPIAHEDDAVRGVLCAVRIVEAIADYTATVDAHRVPSGLAVRVGIESGRVVVARTGSDARDDISVTGAVLHTA